MTVKLMQRFGVEVQCLNGLQHLHIPAGQTYKSPGMAYVEGDASSGEAAAVCWGCGGGGRGGG